MILINCIFNVFRQSVFIYKGKTLNVYRYHISQENISQWDSAGYGRGFIYSSTISTFVSIRFHYGPEEIVRSISINVPCATNAKLNEKIDFSCGDT